MRRAHVHQYRVGVLPEEAFCDQWLYDFGTVLPALVGD
jgi:hypothetical protein